MLSCSRDHVITVTLPPLEFARFSSVSIEAEPRIRALNLWQELNEFLRNPKLLLATLHPRVNITFQSWATGSAA